MSDLLVMGLGSLALASGIAAAYWTHAFRDQSRRILDMKLDYERRIAEAHTMSLRYTTLLGETQEKLAEMYRKVGEVTARVDKVINQGAFK